MCNYIIFRLGNNAHIINAIISNELMDIVVNSPKKDSCPIMFTFYCCDNDTLIEQKHVGIIDKITFQNLGGVLVINISKLMKYWCSTKKSQKNEHTNL